MSEQSKKLNIPEPKISFESQIKKEIPIEKQWYNQQPDWMLSVLLIVWGILHFSFNRWLISNKKKMNLRNNIMNSSPKFSLHQNFGLVLVVIGIVMFFF